MHVVLDGLRGAIDGATFDRGVGQEGYAERLEREGVTAPSTWLSERPCGCAGAGDPNHNQRRPPVARARDAASFILDLPTAAGSGWCRAYVRGMQ